MSSNIVFTKLSDFEDEDFDNESSDNNTFKLIQETNNDIKEFEEQKLDNQNNQNKLNKMLFKYNNIDITKGRFILIILVITFILLYMIFITKN